MPTFSAYDGPQLAYRVTGAGPPLVCVPGGPMQDSAYLGDLGGLSAHRQLIITDLRGTGRSATPQDVASCRCDRLTDDVEALREHLGLDRLDLLAHSAGTNVVARYAELRPARVGSLALITPSLAAVGITVTGDVRLETARLHAAEPWFPEAYEALEAVVAGRATDASWQAIEPFAYGRWDAAAQAHQAARGGQRNDDAAAAFGAEGAFDPAATRAALARCESPALLLAGEADVNSPPPAVAEYAALLPNGRFAVQPGAGHFPWLHDAEWFVAATEAFLGGGQAPPPSPSVA
ncbi:alpha/beta hydrolase [Streptomyces armeniacus]|uniref:Alpha/beta hydrolase n=1 Tax=Streptomyces armeniacus TaxID=83291 RepID=A0A345XSF2_9ACTN|nr:alpha/beta hydrolase [Streptomyces armeniacus]AXK34568.1 alpha/beta hydrolase [Streptomyces armeniacus]